MDSVIVRAVQGQATPHELAELSAWRSASSVNERRYQEVARLVETLRSATHHGSVASPRATDVIQRGERRRRAQTRLRVRSYVPWAVAAAAVLILLTRLASDPKPVSPGVGADLSSQSQEIVTGAGELATVRMADGSVARLAPRSVLRLLPSPHERAVWVEGRVFFAAASDSNRPFRVRTPEGDLIALGTRFDVRTEPQGLQLSVLEGRVALIARGERAEVGTGEAAAVRDGLPIAIMKIADPAEIARWMRRFLAFQSTPLQSVAVDIERVYGRRVVLADPSLARETVTATFTDESFEEVLRVVCTVVGVRCAVTESQVTISR